ncbi:YgfZ/GcvT domain-containing protein [Tabrizicola sp. M-4]|uniref:CAF17-like 4Fe-4S cluster assembly/insertion protein YgfZ n=1 Tax=Tabrizicola sp. M-4 TaxID=3055847 RepID=UPI003DA92AAE
MQGEAATDRRVVTVEGADALPFLQGLVSNDVLRLGKGPGIVWAALLTPQGKYLADFFIVRQGDSLLLDLPEVVAEATLRRLTMYRLRADVRLTPSALHVQRGLGDTPPDALPDPRHPALGWRRYGVEAGTEPQIDWDAIRVAHVVPETGRELIVDDSYILESGFERLHGVDFRKGCYVGQEVTARMKHKTELRKGLARVRVTGEAGYGAEITADGKPAGTLFTRSGDHAIAYLRFDRATGPMRASAALVELDQPVDGAAIVQP